MAISSHNLSSRQEEEMSVTYNATGHGAVRRIRTPGYHDVLSGRGGNVNAHTGNCAFRKLVATRKNDYTHAHSKETKAQICLEVISHVTDLGGRFLQKEANSGSGSWWVEVNPERVMAKTSQALREGAPKLRQSHRGDTGTPGPTPRIRRRRPAPISTTTAQDMDQPLAKRVRIEDYISPLTTANNDMSHPMLRDEQPILDDEPGQENTASAVTHFLPMMPAPRHFGSQRSNSLALSDISADWRDHSRDQSSSQLDFVNPFEDESHLMEAPSPRVGLYRESSGSTKSSDMAGLAALMSPSNKSSQHSSSTSFGSLGSLGKVRHCSSTGINKFCGTDESNCNEQSRDGLSIGSCASVGMPVWEWFDREWKNGTIPVSP